MKKPVYNTTLYHRRRFISTGVKASLLAGLLSPLEQACTSADRKKTKDPSKTVNKKNIRGKWTTEKLLINAKTNVIHLPTASFYIYYDQIKNAKTVTINDWENQTGGKTTFNKNKSGNIFEILSLQKLRNGINDNSLNSAIHTLSTAFGKDCDNINGVNINATNYRLHELMLQFISLNNYIPFKWKTFNDMVRKPVKPGKRQQWMADEISFDQRVTYIRERETEYKDRLARRALKYNLT